MSRLFHTILFQRSTRWALVGLAFALTGSLLRTFALTIKTPTSSSTSATDIQGDQEDVITVNPAADVPSGKLAYVVNTTTSRTPVPLDYNLILRATGSHVAQATPETYKVQADNIVHLYACLWSPDQRFLLFQEGLPGDSSADYLLFLWDAKAHKLHQLFAEDTLRNPTLVWSPDSKQFAFILGGNAAGETSDDFQQYDPMRLFTYDVATGTSHFIAALGSGTHVDDCAFTRSGTILFVRGGSESVGNKATVRPQICEAPVTGGPVTSLLLNAADPTPSPDGRWVVYWGTPDVAGDSEGEAQSAKDQAKGGVVQASRLGLCLLDRQIGKATLLQPTGIDAEPQVIWSHDSTFLITITNQYIGGRSWIDTASPAPPGTGSAHIKVINVPSLSQRDVATLVIKDSTARDDPRQQRKQFTPVALSVDNQYIFVQTDQYGERLNDFPWLNEYIALEAVRLSDGVQTEVWKAKNPDAISWSLGS